MERWWSSRSSGRRARRTIAAAAAIVGAGLALVGAGTAATPVVSVDGVGAVAWVASPSTVAAAAALGQTTVGVGPGAGVVVCHVGAAANVLRVPLVVQVSAIRAFLLANPRDYLGTCKTPARHGDAGNGPGQEGADAGGNAGGDVGASAQAPGATSASAGTVPCTQRLVIGSVQIAPLVIRSARQPVLLRLVVRTGCGDPVANAVVTLRSAPLGKITRTIEQRTAADGSVVFASTTTKRLPLVRGGRLVLFARATRPSQAASGCNATQPLAAGRLVSIRTAKPVD